MFPLIRQFDKEKLELEKKRDELIENLRKSLNDESPKNSELKDTIKKLQGNQAAVNKLKKDKFQEIKDILSLKEQAKLILFMESFPKEIQSIIWDAKRKERERARRRFSGD